MIIIIAIVIFADDSHHHIVFPFQIFNLCLIVWPYILLITMNDFDNGEVLGENIDSGKNASERWIISEIYGKFALSRTNWLLGLLDPFDGI